MVMGVERECIFCGERGRSCVLPYVCVSCETSYLLAENELSARLNAKPAAGSPELAGEGRDGHS